VTALRAALFCARPIGFVSFGYPPQRSLDDVWPKCFAGKSTFIGQNVILASITGRFNQLGGGSDDEVQMWLQRI
jgi:hypothetical protein